MALLRAEKFTKKRQVLCLIVTFFVMKKLFVYDSEIGIKVASEFLLQVGKTGIVDIGCEVVEQLGDVAKAFDIN